MGTLDNGLKREWLRLTAENARLRTALKPFADAAPQNGLYLNTVRLIYSDGSKGSLTPEDFLAARAALEQGSTPTK